MKIENLKTVIKLLKTVIKQSPVACVLVYVEC